MKKLAFVLLAALTMSACSTQTVDTGITPVTTADASSWTVPYSIEGGQGVSFMLPEGFTYAGGGDTDTSSSSWVTDKEDGYFTIRSFVLIKCADDKMDCGLDTTVTATPKEVFENLVKSPEPNCIDKGEIPVGNVTGRLFSCESPTNDLVFFYGSKGAYQVSNDLKLLLGDESLSTPIFKTFLSTFQVE